MTPFEEIEVIFDYFKQVSRHLSFRTGDSNEVGAAVQWANLIAYQYAAALLDASGGELSDSQILQTFRYARVAFNDQYGQDGHHDVAIGVFNDWAFRLWSTARRGQGHQESPALFVEYDDAKAAAVRDVSRTAPDWSCLEAYINLRREYRTLLYLCERSRIAEALDVANAISRDAVDVDWDVSFVDRIKVALVWQISRQKPKDSIWRLSGERDDWMVRLALAQLLSGERTLGEVLEVAPTRYLRSAHYWYGLKLKLSGSTRAALRHFRLAAAPAPATLIETLAARVELRIPLI